MKLLIVDDEYHVIRAIKFLLSATSLEIDQILEASSAREAMDIIGREHPELLITDIAMNDLTGIDLMEYLNGLDYTVKTIVISGYNNFDYIRETLRNGGIDYLLKPIDSAQLNAALEKAIRRYREEENRKQEQQKNREIISSMSALCKETLLYRMMTQAHCGKYFEELYHIVPRLTFCTSCIVGYLNLSDCCPDCTESRQERITQAALMLGGELESTSTGFCFLNPYREDEMLLFLYQDCTGSRRRLESLLPLIGRKTSLDLTFGLSLLNRFPDGIQTAYNQAVTAFYDQDASGSAKPVLSYNPRRVSLKLPANPEKERLIFSALITGNEALIDRALNQWLQAVFPEGSCPLYYIFAFIDYYNQLSEDWKKQLQTHYPNLHLDSSPVRLQYARLIGGERDSLLPALSARIKKDIFRMYRALTSQNSNPDNDVIYQIAHYIDLNYNKPFSQNGCAQLFFINKDYMCRKFKSVFQVNMIAYLTSLRIGHAKEFLANPDIRIKDIASLVGFEDEKYFSRQFRKTTGMTPNEYRRRVLTSPDADGSV